MGVRSEDLALVARVIDGDEGAFSELQSHTRGIVESCLSRTRKRWPDAIGEGGDVRQEFYTMLIDRDYRVLRGYRGEAALTTWIHTLAIRFFYRRARKLQKSVHYSLDDQHTPPEAAGESPERLHLQAEQIEGVREVLGRLSTEERVLLKLLFEEDAPTHVVGQALGITAAGVRMKKKRLLKKLTKKLKDLWP